MLVWGWRYLTGADLTCAGLTGAGLTSTAVTDAVPGGAVLNRGQAR